MDLLPLRFGGIFLLYRSLGPGRSLDRIKLAQREYRALAEDVKDDPVLAPEALYGLAVAEETLAIEAKNVADQLEKAERRYKEVVDKFPTSARGKAAKKRLEELKDIGHNLEKAASRVVVLKLYPLSGFVESKASLIGLLNPYYSKKYFEYRVVGSMSPPATKELDVFLSQLLKLAEQQLIRSAPRQPT